MLTLVRQSLIENPIKAFKTFAHDTTVLLGGWTPVFSIIVASFLSSQLKVKVPIGAVAFLEAGGLATYNSQLSALLACVVLSTAFGNMALSAPWDVSNSRADVSVILLRAIYREALLRPRVVQPAFTGLLITLAANLQYLFGAGSYTSLLDAILQAFQSLTAALVSKWSLYPVRDPAKCLLNDVQGITKVGDKSDGKGPEMPRGRGAAQGASSKLSTMEKDSKDSSKLSRDGWELIEKAGAAKNDANTITDEEKHQQALLHEVFRLINECKERKNVDWDGAIAVLEKGQKDGNTWVT
ncbi:hypothetical protein A1F94_005528 [Pyrenophora tritici-repentis]|uniref:Uncharacterized protein n=2 Tax=Pyrenophora tritici-repentis TaxID=45151 RepID=A0A2W1GNC8_9PLEO|nr:uncharacterized protein PTRG_05808 [Pyrenophora tritici-repentis Pt-1C-BFP]KAA8618978.1 hypothetical protein PtrV1_08407 [Pyrenophora tritici-repentis]EDU48728.1 predicted protein [Pyrenophora tritici-repentis Pt-1C-BFP]KAF7449371.1 hypothetical protein A1F99_064200 [Pyrenophora tritici-repentis]KAF7570608.1 hypothetical protein PtrM4_106100 [Pyrenophora tritici-repentis]KAG9383617.1 hypothetical protein A1F94_005528 [Pyrenophora tritici-repentis]